MKTKIELLKTSIISKYKNIGNEKALISGKDVYTGNQIASEIENETEFGIHILENLLNLTIDLVKRDKLSIPSMDEDVYLTEPDKNIIYNSKTDKDICMYFDEENKELILKALNKYEKNRY